MACPLLDKALQGMLARIVEIGKTFGFMPD